MIFILKFLMNLIQNGKRKKWLLVNWVDFMLLEQRDMNCGELIINYVVDQVDKVIQDYYVFF